MSSSSLLTALRSTFLLIMEHPALPVQTREHTLAVSRADVERLVGQHVGDLALYERALTHRSVLRGQPDSHLDSNERLEFLGDAILGALVADYLYGAFPEQTEGFLTRLRAKIVSGKALADAAEQLGLGACILLSENMERAGGRQNTTILADAFEALLGAIYLDLGLERARAFLEETTLEPLDLEALARRHDNHKSRLLEYVQAQSWPQPEYMVTDEHGPSHDKTFEVDVRINGTVYGHGIDRSKKGAEQQAAAEALVRLENEAG